MQRRRMFVSAVSVFAMAMFAVSTAAFAKGKKTPPPNLTTLACGDGTVVVSPALLWPPNHKLVTINVAYTETTSDADSIGIVINSITDDQTALDPGTGTGSDACGPSKVDWVFDTTPVTNTDPSAAATTVQVRAERCAQVKKGAENYNRHYDINLTCQTADGVNDTIDMFVTVPHSKAELKKLEGLK